MALKRIEGLAELLIELDNSNGSLEENEARITTLFQNATALTLAESDGYASQLLDVQQDCVDIKEAHKAVIREIFEEVDAYIKRDLEWSNEENEMLWHDKLQWFKQKYGGE